MSDSAQKKSANKIGSTFIIAGCAIAGCVGIFTRALSGFGLSSLSIAELRISINAIALVIFLLFFNRSLLKIQPRDLWLFFCGGALGAFLFTFCYFVTQRMASLSVAAILLYTAPVFVMIISRFVFKERFTKRKVLALALAIAGCFFVSGVLAGDSTITFVGLLVGLCSGLCYALWTIFSRLALIRGYNSLTVTTWMFIMAAIAGSFFADWASVGQTFSTTPISIFYTVLMGLACGALANSLFTTGLKYLEASSASIVATSEPIAATIVGVVAFSEIPAIPQIIGILLIIGAIVLLNTKGRTQVGAESDSE